MMEDQLIKSISGPKLKYFADFIIEMNVENANVEGMLKYQS